MTVERETKALRCDGHFRKRSSSTDQQSLTPGKGGSLVRSHGT